MHSTFIESILFPYSLWENLCMYFSYRDGPSLIWSSLYLRFCFFLFFLLFHSSSATKGQWTVGRSICPIAPSDIDLYGALFKCIGCTIDPGLYAAVNILTLPASILINILLLIMYLIDQFGPWVNWSIILIFFLFLLFYLFATVVLI